MLDELRELAIRVPFDERGNSDIQLEDISLLLLRDYLAKVGSRLAEQVATFPLTKILDQMELYTGPKENRLIRNVAAMMFSENPSKFFLIHRLMLSPSLKENRKPQTISRK